MELNPLSGTVYYVLEKKERDFREKTENRREFQRE
jgi:hypothetical protein